MANNRIATIKDIGKWDGPGSLDEAALFGIEPLFEIVKLIDLDLEDKELDVRCHG